MRITIDGQTFPMSFDWTFREAEVVKRLTGVRAGEVAEEISRGDAMAAVSLGMVAFMRAGRNPEELLDMSVSSIECDFSQEDEAGPPVEGGEEPPAEERSVQPN